MPKETKVTKTITLDRDLLKWLEEMTQKKEFGSLSHGIEKALVRLKEEYEKPHLQYDREPHLEYDTREKEGKKT
jgi:Arc/MetJ-type ribon-helix-helix transcriptional regulator